VTTVTFKAVLGRQRDARPAPRAPLPPDASTLPLAAQAAPDAPVSRTARLLALGYRVRRLLDSGALPDQREAAARLGIVFPQMTHVLNLTYLAPAIQEQILSGELVVAEARLRALSREPSWSTQTSSSVLVTRSLR
jgi:hypothetical protein